MKLYQRSKVFVDICRAGQTGMSMRTIEAYGMNKRIITDNYENIIKDKFVNDISMISCETSDEELIRFIKKVAKSKYSHTNELTIENWCRHLLKL